MARFPVRAAALLFFAVYAFAQPTLKQATVTPDPAVTAPGGKCTIEVILNGSAEIDILGPTGNLPQPYRRTAGLAPLRMHRSPAPQSGWFPDSSHKRPRPAGTPASPASRWRWPCGVSRQRARWRSPKSSWWRSAGRELSIPHSAPSGLDPDQAVRRARLEVSSALR